MVDTLRTLNSSCFNPSSLGGSDTLVIRSLRQIILVLVLCLSFQIQTVGLGFAVSEKDNTRSSSQKQTTLVYKGRPFLQKRKNSVFRAHDFFEPLQSVFRTCFVGMTLQRQGVICSSHLSFLPRWLHPKNRKQTDLSMTYRTQHSQSHSETERYQ